MKEILAAGFKGDKNASKVLLDNLHKNTGIDILYLENNFETSGQQLKNTLKGKAYDYVFAFGQKPVIRSIYIEKAAKNGSKTLETNYNYAGLKEFMDGYFKTRVSLNAGNYLCNNIYYKGLEYIYDNNLGTEMIFIHIPYLDKMDISYFSEIFAMYINDNGGKRWKSS